jgi:hypothetical protein
MLGVWMLSPKAQQWPRFDHWCSRRVLCEADVICVSGNLIVSRKLEFGRAFCEAIGRRFGHLL